MCNMFLWPLLLYKRARHGTFWILKMNITILSLSDQPEVLSTLMMLVLLLQLTARRAAPFSANCISPPQVFIWPHH